MIKLGKLKAMNNKETMYYYGVKNEKDLQNHMASFGINLFKDKTEPVCSSYNPIIALFCTDLPRPDMDSGSNRLYHIIKILHSIGARVYIFTHNDWTQNTTIYIDSLKPLVEDIIIHDNQKNIYLNALFDQLQNDKKIIFDIIYYHGYEMHQAYNKYIYYLSPSSKIITDSIDVHWSRFEKEPNSCKEKVLKNKNLEIASYKKSDVVFAVTEDDRQKILEHCHNTSVKILSNIHSKSFLKQNNNNNRCIFVGGEKHTPNIDAVIRAIDIVNKYNSQKNTDFIYLDIVGEFVDNNILKLSSEYVIFHQKVSNKNLDNLYSSASFSLSPLSWGSGIKGKICESICKGIPVITTDTGNEGINLKNQEDAFICDKEEEFIDSMRILLSMGNTERQKLKNNAFEKINKLTSVESAREILSTTISCKPIVLSILTHNNAYLTEKLLKNIIEKTRYPNYHIHITSDKCRDNTKHIVLQYQKKYPGLITYHYNHKNLYFILSHNNVIKKYPEADIVLMNEDIEIITDKWLTKLYNTAYSSPNIGCAGGKSLDIYGRISEAGAELHNSGEGRNIGRNQNRYQKVYNYERNVGYVSGCLLYMKRKIINQIGLMDTSYYPCYYEDSDWQYTMHTHGYLTIYNPRIEFIHREGSSCGVSQESGLKKHMLTNKEKFKNKFNSYNIEKYNENTRHTP